MTRVLIVDDHPLIRERLAELLVSEANLVVCGEADDCRGALALVEAQHPHLVLVDLILKSSHGLDLIKDIHTRHPEVLTLVISMHAEPLLAERAIRAGARGYVDKQQSSSTILQAVRKVLKGEIFLTESLAMALASKLATRASLPSSSPELLTDRELRVFELIGQGHGTRQIALKMRVGVSTVQTYRARIKQKLHLHNADELRTNAIRWAQGADS